jgi:predicted nucleotidyltransferase
MYSLAQKENTLDARIKRLLLKCRETLSSVYPEVEIILYGSQARNAAQPDSDIDLLVLLNGPLSAEDKKNIHDMLYDIALDDNAVISVIIKAVDKWNLPISQATRLYQIIQKEGIKVA